MRLRDVFHWKTYFYNLILPMLGRGSPRSSAGILRRLSVTHDFVTPWRHEKQLREIVRAKEALNANWEVEKVRAALAANLGSYAARDYLLDQLTDAAALERFDWNGLESVQQHLDRGEGLLVIGSHYGAHLAALHGLYRRGWPLRLLVQRPRHVSRYLAREFERDEPLAQSRFFVRRGLTTGAAAERILLARTALRQGLVVYLNGDIPWTGPNTRPGRILGQPISLLSLWTDLSVLTGCGVVFLFATHQPGGRYEATFTPPRAIRAGEEAEAFEAFVCELERRVILNPAEAIPYFLWPGFQRKSPT